MTIKSAMLGILVFVFTGGLALADDSELILSECRRAPTHSFCHPQNFADPKSAPPIRLRTPTNIRDDGTTGYQWTTATPYYLSNRERLSTYRGEKPQATGRLLFGKVTVLVQAANTDTGELMHDHGLKSSKRPVWEPKPLKAHDFTSLLHKQLSDSTNGITIYVHGIRNSFADAARDAASLKSSLPPEKEVVFYSWPAEVFGTSAIPWSRNFPIHFSNGYKRTRRMADQSVAALADSLKDILSFGAKSSSIYAHSMGSLLTVAALRRLAETEGSDFGGLQNVALVAADLSIKDFNNLEMQLDVTNNPSSLHVYCHPYDMALLAGQRHDGDQRVGLCFGDQDRHRAPFVSVFRVDRLHVADPDEDAFRHSYQASEPVLSHAAKELSKPNELQRPHTNGHRKSISDVFLRVKRLTSSDALHPGTP